jgi:hypothetical protein
MTEHDDPLVILDDLEAVLGKHTRLVRPGLQRLRAAVEAQAARIARLESAANLMMRQADKWDWLLHSDERGRASGEMRVALNESPRQSVAELQARGLEALADEFTDGIDHFPETLRLEADRIRSEASEGREEGLA